MNIPNAPISWIPAVTGQDHGNILTLLQERPIVAWFSQNGQGVRLLQKVTARLGDDLWMITADEGRKVSVEPTSLAKALHYLTPENGWVPCEFADSREFHRAALAYLES